MTYKAQTFCQDWCDNKECFRNYAHIEEANKNNLIPESIPVCYFVSPPIDCTNRIEKSV